MSKIAIIGGTGLTSLKGLEITNREICQTPFGEPSSVLVHGKLSGKEVLFLPRHGPGHTIPPHKINYRANIWLLKEAGVSSIIAVNAVGAIHENMKPGELVIPDQIIDYTTSRVNTFFEDGLKEVVHIDFTQPYCDILRNKIIESADALDIDMAKEATYGATEGPRLETAQEVNRLERDGCDIIGMTGMPEAALAREVELCYACIAVVANAAAGRSAEPLTMEMIEQNLKQGIKKARSLLEETIPRL